MIIDAFTEGLSSALYSLNLAMRSKTGRRYTWKEVLEMVQGFEGIQIEEFFPLNEEPYCEGALILRKR